MKKIFYALFALCFFTLICHNAGHAEFHPVRLFSLSDGTTLKGKLMGVRERDGAYIIETTKLGTVAVKPGDILDMQNLGPDGVTVTQLPNPSPSQPNTAANGGAMNPGVMQKTQDMLLADPDFNQSLQELMADPEIMAVFKDAELMQAIMSMDPATIQSNPKVQQLLQNPQMQQLIQKAGQKMMNQGDGTTP